MCVKLRLNLLKILMKTCLSTDVMEDCKDTNTLCRTWADNSQCVVNPSYMKVFCMKSCRTCTPGNYIYIYTGA